MLRLIDWYLAKTVLSTTFVTMFVILFLRTFFSYMDELKDVGKGQYGSLDALIYVLLSSPNLLYEYFPICILLGGLFGLGVLAQNSELLVMRASGVSTYRIAYAVMKANLVLIVIVVLVGEWVAPKATKFAKQLRTIAITEGRLTKSQSGIWLKEGNSFIQVADVYATGDLSNITIINLNDKLELESVYQAKTGRYEKQSAHWQLQDITFTRYNEISVVSRKLESMPWDSQFLNPNNVNVVGLNPSDLNLVGLINYKNYLRANGLQSEAYELAFWNKLFMPISIAVMMYMALSFIFGPLRSTTMGARILAGTIVGFAFHLTSKTFGNLASEIPPVVSAILPSIIFALIAYGMMRKAG